MKTLKSRRSAYIVGGFGFGPSDSVPRRHGGVLTTICRHGLIKESYCINKSIQQNDDLNTVSFKVHRN